MSLFGSRVVSDERYTASVQELAPVALPELLLTAQVTVIGVPDRARSDQQ